MRLQHFISIGVFLTAVSLYLFYQRETPDLPDQKLLDRLYLSIEDKDTIPLKEDLEQFSDWLNQSPTNTEIRLLRAGLNLKFGDTEARILAKQELKKLGLANDSDGYKALSYLAFSPVNNGVFPEDIVHASEGILKHPNRTPEDQFRATDSIISLCSPSERAKWYSHTIQNQSQQDKQLLCQWLMNHGQYKHITNLISQQEVLSTPALFFMKFQALLLLQNLNSAEQLLTPVHADLSEFERKKAEAYLGRARGNADALKEWVSWSMKNATPSQLVEAGRFALLSGFGKLAQDAYAQVLKKSPDDLESAECSQLLQLALKMKDTPLAYTAAKTLHNRHPMRPGAHNNYIWLALLMGEPAGPLLEQATQLQQNQTQNNNFLSTIALAHFKNQQPDQALWTLRKLKGSKQLQPAERVLLAAILSAMGKEEEAKKWVTGVTEQQLLSEEWQLLNLAK